MSNNININTILKKIKEELNKKGHIHLYKVKHLCYMWDKIGQNKTKYQQKVDKMDTINKEKYKLKRLKSVNMYKDVMDNVYLGTDEIDIYQSFKSVDNTFPLYYKIGTFYNVDVIFIKDKEQRGARLSNNVRRFLN